MKDDQGTALTFPARPTHVVSLVPSSTEIIYADGAGDALAAGTQYDNDPPEAKSTALIKGLKPSIEAVMAYKPDLVLASTSNATDLIQQLRALHVPVLHLDTQDFAGVYHDIMLVGEIMNGVPAVQKTVQAMQQEMATVTAAVAKTTSKPRVSEELSADSSGKVYTVGPGPFIGDFVSIAGGVNTFHGAASSYPQIGLKSLIAADPQVIILDDAAYGATPSIVAQRPGWSTISAVKAGRLYPINDDLVSRPGPRFADGLLAMAKLIHPELFP